MRRIFFPILLILILLSACSPAIIAPTATMTPPTSFPTEIPATPTSEITTTPYPTIPSTEEVVARESVEIPMNHEGVTGVLREARYYSFEESQDLVYKAPLYEGVDLYSYFRPKISPAQLGCKLLFLNYTTNTPDMMTYAETSDILVTADAPDEEEASACPGHMWFASEAKNPRGFLGLAIPVSQSLVVKRVIARDADGKYTVIFNASADLVSEPSHRKNDFH